MGKTAPAPGGTTTQRKTMEEVQKYWCSETAMAGFNNIPVCDAKFDVDDLFQTPVDHELEGPIPDQGFFNIKNGWASECSLPIFQFSRRGSCAKFGDASRGILFEQAAD